MVGELYEQVRALWCHRDTAACARHEDVCRTIAEGLDHALGLPDSDQISIGHDFHEYAAVCRIQQRTENVHGDELEWAADWEDFKMSGSCPIRLVACTWAVINYGCALIVGHVWPTYRASHGVVHALFRGVSS